MPLCDDFHDEPETLPHWQFDDCAGCVNRDKPRTCRMCTSGDLFEEVEPQGIDDLFREGGMC
ncbi:hypothetical protein SAMN03159338_1618 [Sphingomonas sp. NFR04]|jgi:hypothetical protein|uniref:hypothetical protein n=1 Tax=Sphingomonas sp. NFR04 TaxID=1566283 RepID=UPI0008E20618|nr:hypothetical protein [Sphingomonas sp. NFR04]SFJ51255.1 hypothetical protein SAMN03159338_1618 [Sphingomonas sp. NFR04]